jgi:predicted nucleic acid-binding protein
MIVIFDTTLLSNFAHVQHADWLELLFDKQAVTTAEVLAELRQGETTGFVPRQDWRWLTVVELTLEEQVLAGQYRGKIDVGEAACLAAAVERGYTLLSDDFAARRLASKMGVKVSGTLGVLRQLVALSHLTLPEANRILGVMIDRGYRSPVRSLEDLAG